METKTPTAKRSIMANFVAWPARHKKITACVVIIALILGLGFGLGWFKVSVTSSTSEYVTCTCPAPCTERPKFSAPVGISQTEADQKCQEACVLACP